MQLELRTAKTRTPMMMKTKKNKKGERMGLGHFKDFPRELGQRYLLHHIPGTGARATNVTRNNMPGQGLGWHFLSRRTTAPFFRDYICGPTRMCGMGQSVM